MCEYQDWELVIIGLSCCSRQRRNLV